MDGKCGMEGVVYQAKVYPGEQDKNLTEEDKATIAKNNNGVIWKPKIVESYIGRTGGTFKARWNFTKSQCKLRHLPSTALSTYIWKLKDNFYHHYTIKWDIIARANTYSTSSKICNLCNKERYYLVYRKDLCTLNSQDEIIRKCRHRRGNLIGQAKKEDSSGTS